MTARRAQACIDTPRWLSIRLTMFFLSVFLTMLGEEHLLRPHIVFFCFGMYQSLRGSITIYLFNCFKGVAEIYVVLQRIQVRPHTCCEKMTLHVANRLVWCDGLRSGVGFNSIQFNSNTLFIPSGIGNLLTYSSQLNHV